MKSMTCIVCPVGCHLSVDDALKVTGNRCPRGETYGIQEMKDPRRMLTTTVRTTDPMHPRLSVKSSKPLPKGKIFEVIAALDDVIVSKHVKIGDVIVSNVLNTEIDIIATSSLHPESHERRTL